MTSPKWLDLRKFHFPLQAKLSILHRITGVLTFLFLLTGLGILNFLLFRPENFEIFRTFFHSPIGKLSLWLGLSSLLYHWLAGIRHLMMAHDFLQLQTRYSHRSGQWLLGIYTLFWLGLSWRIWG